MTWLGSSALSASFLLLPLALLGLLTLAVHRLERRKALPSGSVRHCLVLQSAWLLVWGALAMSGVLNTWDGFPPRPLFALPVLLGVPVVLACSRLGQVLARGFGFAELIGFQVFRLPLELAMYRAMLEGLMPAQMSFAGYNYDIVTGVAAGCLFVWARWRPLPRWSVWAFNLLGSVLLTTILAVAIASLPTFAWFGANQTNTWVFHFPYIYLPAVLVPSALFGHLLLFRKLAAERSRAATPKPSLGAADFMVR